MRSAVARASWPLAVPSIGLTKMGRAKTKKVSQCARKEFVFQVKKLLPGQQTAFSFHDDRLLQIFAKVKFDDDASAQADFCSEP